MSGAYWGDRTDTSPQALADRRLRLPCRECGGTYERRARRVRHRNGCSEITYYRQDRETAALADINSPLFASWEVGQEWEPVEVDL